MGRAGGESTSPRAQSNDSGQAELALLLSPSVSSLSLQGSLGTGWKYVSWQLEEGAQGRPLRQRQSV